MLKKTTILFLFTLTAHFANSQIINRELLDQNGKVTLLGKVSHQRLSEAPFQEWFVSNEKAYVPEKASVKKLKKQLTSVDSITIFMGTWCGDSKREVPRLTRLLAEAKYDLSKVNIICLDRRFNFYKQSPQHEEAGLNIHRVPTVMLHADGKELGRMVEEPVATLEEDLLRIIDGSYEPHFQVVNRVEDILRNEGYEKLNENQATYVEQLKPIAQKSSELTTYARTLLTTWRIPEAVAVLELNQQLFPETEYAHLHLANLYMILGSTAKATTCCEKALSLNPESTTAKSMLKKME